MTSKLLSLLYKRFSVVARLLNDLTKEDKAWMWTEKEQQVFDKLKVKFTITPVLAYPEDDVKYCFECDTSDFTTRVVLFLEKEGKWHPAPFSSHSMSPE